MFIMTKKGWRPLWAVSQPSLKDVKENIAGLNVPASFATEQHLFLLAHREVQDQRRAEYLAKPTGIYLGDKPKKKPKRVH